MERESGGVIYGRKDSRYSRELKSVYKIGAVTAIGGNNPINDYYEYLMREKGYPDYQARHKAARRLAILSLGVFKIRHPGLYPCFEKLFLKEEQRFSQVRGKSSRKVVARPPLADESTC